MASEQENRIVAEVMDNMKMAETEESSARRYVRRAVDPDLLLQRRSSGTPGRNCSPDCRGYVKGRSAGLHRKRNIIRHPWRHNDFLPRSKRFQERHGGLHEEL